MKRKKSLTWILFLLFSFFVQANKSDQDFNSDEYFVEQDNETEFTELSDSFGGRNKTSTTADFLFDTITNLWDFFQSENIQDIAEDDEEFEVFTTTLLPGIEDGEVGEVTEAPENYRFLFPPHSNIGDSFSTLEKEEETQSCTDYVSNRHYSLEANSSLHFNLNSWMQRSIVTTASVFDIQANGSCLIFGSEHNEKPSFSNYTFVRGLPKNTTVTISDLDVTDAVRVAIHCEAPFPVFLELTSNPYAKPVRREINLDGDGTETNELPVHFIKKCDERCYHHGLCVNGTCQCLPGWNGKFCSIPGCVDDCHGHGQCQLIVDEKWGCNCQSGFTGANCQIAQETQCDDKDDNDKDDLVDCMDPDCCSHSICASKHVCLTVSDPLEFNHTSSAFFWTRVEHLVEPGGTQSYAQLSTFDQREICLLRGRVVLANGQGLIGVRISQDDHVEEGFTLTRHNGYFDFVCSCNSSSVLKLKFGRSPFPYVEKVFFALPNQITHIGEIIMSHSIHREAEDIEEDATTCCLDYKQCSIQEIKVNEPWQHAIAQIDFEDSDLSLAYNSRQILNAKSQMSVTLLPKVFTSKLYRVMIKVTIEGVIFEETLEAEPELKWQLSNWNATNALGQHIFGKARVVVEAGYQFRHCASTQWDMKIVHLHGNSPPLSSSLFAGWSLNLHHHLEPHQGMLYFGHGGRVDLEAEGIPTVEDLLVFEEELPVTITSNAHHLVYVGTNAALYELDTAKLTRRKLFDLQEASMGIKFYLHYDTIEQMVFVSMPAEKLVIKLEPQSMEITLVAGDSKTCRGNLQCGDGGRAKQARLSYPKGVVTTLRGEVFIADGRRIRKVCQNGTIVTVAGTTGVGEEWKPPKQCQKAAKQSSLQWPTSLTLNPFDQSLFFLDGDDVIQLKQGSLIYLKSCYNSRYGLSNAKALEFSPQKGSLYVVAGHDSHPYEGSLFTMDAAFGDVKDRLRATELGGISWLSDIASLADGSVLACEPQARKVRRINYGQVYRDDKSGNIMVPWHEEDEVYIFSSSGKHLETRSLFSDSLLVGFAYDTQGNLERVYNKNQESLRIEQKIQGDFVYLNEVHVATLMIDSSGLLGELRLAKGSTYQIKYGQHNQLASLTINGKGVYYYTYNAHGRLIDVTSPQAEILPFTKASHENNSLITYRAQDFPRRESENARILVPFKARDISWEFYMQAYSRTFDPFSGLGKRMVTNESVILSSEMHPRSGAQSIYDGNGNLIVKMEEDYVPPRRYWQVNTSQTYFLAETFDYQRRLTQWQWGNLKEQYDYDELGRLTRVHGDLANVTYQYASNHHAAYPNRVMSYTLEHDQYGGLGKVTLPSGLEYTFQKIPMLGNSLVKYSPPWGNISLTYLLDDQLEKSKRIIMPEPLPQTIFQVRQEPFQTYISKENFIYTTQKDEYGRVKLKSFSLNGKKMHQQSFEYVGPFLSKHSVINDLIRHTIYDYQGDKLQKMTGSKNQIQFGYDVDGNLVFMDVNGIEINYVFEDDRLVQAGPLQQVVYNQDGYIVSKNGFEFEFSEKGHMISITNQAQNLTTKLSYNSNDKLMGFSQAEEIWEFHYGPDDRLSRLYSVPKEEHVYFHYDGLNHIFAITTSENTTYFVASDAKGTPLEIFDQHGSLIKQWNVRTPFGFVLAETGGSLDFPMIGFLGGLEFPNSGIVILNGNQPFDTHLGQFLTPQTKNILSSSQWTEITEIHPYRLPNPLKYHVHNMNNFEEWLELFNIKSPLKYLKNRLSIMTQVGITKSLSFVKPRRKKATLCNGIAAEFQLLGPNVILRLNETTRVIQSRVLEGAGTIEETLAQLMNGSFVMVGNAKAQELDFYVPLDPLEASIHQKELSMLQNSIIKRMAVEDDEDEENEIDNNGSKTLQEEQKKETFFITVDTGHVKLTFWMGFSSLEDALHFREKLSSSS